MKSIKNIVIVILAVAFLSSCSLFRKKNKCNSCPSWDSIELTEANPGQNDSEN